MESTKKVLNRNRLSKEKKISLYNYLDECTPIFNSYKCEGSDSIHSDVVMIKDGKCVAFLHSESPTDSFFKYDIIAANTPQLRYNWNERKNIIKYYKNHFNDFFKELRYVSVFLGSENITLFDEFTIRSKINNEA